MTVGHFMLTERCVDGGEREERNSELVMNAVIFLHEQPALFKPKANGEMDGF